MEKIILTSFDFGLVSHPLFNLNEYYPVILMIALSAVLSVALFLIVYYLNPKEIEIEKLSPYECGFDPFVDARANFDVKFYLVAILFIVFDLEIMFLFPWSLVFFQLGLAGMVTMFLFLLVLTVGFFYEWQKGALDWN